MMVKEKKIVINLVIYFLSKLLEIEKIIAVKKKKDNLNFVFKSNTGLFQLSYYQNHRIRIQF